MQSHHHCQAYYLYATSTCCLVALDLVPDSNCAHVDALGHTVMPLLFVERHCLHLFPGKPQSL